MAKREKKFPSETDVAGLGEINGKTPVMVAVAAGIKQLPLERFKDYVEITSIELEPIASGALPTPTAVGSDFKMQVSGGLNGAIFTHSTLPGGSKALTSKEIGLFYWNGTTRIWSYRNGQELPRGLDGKTIEKYNSKNIYGVGSQILWNNSDIYEVVATTLAGETPVTNPEKFDLGLGISKNINFSTIYSTNATITYSGMDIDSDGNIYIVTINSTGLRVYRNGTVLINGVVTADYYSGLTSIACKIQNNKLEILIGTFTAANPTNGVLHVTYNISNNTFTKNGLITTGVNEKLNVYNIIEIGGVLFAALNAGGVVNNGILDTNVINFRIDLFKFESNVWSKVNTISVYNEIWGAQFTKVGGSSAEGSLRGSSMSPTNGVLFTDKDGNIAIKFRSGSSSYNNRVFRKIYKGGVWIADYIDRSYKSFISYSYVNSQGQERTLHKRYTTPTFVWASSVTEVTPLKSGNMGFVLISGRDEYPQGVICRNGKIHIVTRYLASASSLLIRYTVIDESILENGITPKPSGNFKGNLHPSTSVVTESLNIGDYFELDKVGTYKIYSGYSMDLGNIFYNYVTLKKGQTCVAIWNGNTFYISRKIVKSEDLFSNIPFEGLAAFNEFSSDAFRIPTLLETTKKKLIAMTDIRFTSADDYTEMDIAICSSYDNGATWEEYTKVFERTQKNVGWRIHDGAMIVDRNTASNLYGRIWAFGKEWQANESPANQVYWNANPSKLKMFMKYSDDDGLTWSVKEEISFMYVAGYTGWSTGCATGITLTNGTLVLPMYWTVGVAGVGSGYVNRAGFIYKTVGGNWQVGDIIDGVFTNENQIIQDVDGKLIMNSRSTGGTRKVFSLNNIGSGWVNRPDLEVLQDVVGGCQGSFVRYRNTYLFSQPTSYGVSTRSNIKVFYSYDKVNWQELVQLTSNISAGYSELEVSDTTFGILAETTVTAGAIYSISYFDLSYLRNILR